MPNEIDRTSSAQRRSSKLLTAMAIFICLGIAAYMVLTLLVNRQTPATPDTHYTGTNGISVYYDSSVWSVCRMTEDATLGTVLELATADTADSEDLQMRSTPSAAPMASRSLMPTASSSPARST